MIYSKFSATEVNPAKAKTTEQMQQVARNQIQYKIWELEERLDQLKAIKSQVKDVTDWDSYERLIGNVDGDDSGELTALLILAVNYEDMAEGNYF